MTHTRDSITTSFRKKNRCHLRPLPPVRLHVHHRVPPPLSPVAYVCIRRRTIRRQLRAPICRISPLVSLSIDSQASISAILRPGYSKATSTLLLSVSAVWVGWAPNHKDIAGNDRADAAAKLAAEGTLQMTSRGRTPICAHRSEPAPPGVAGLAASDVPFIPM